MLVPKPPVDLVGHCSAIHDNTLYTYSSNGFASIPLERNGTWSKLAMGEPVSDAVCVTGGIEGDENQQALYIVGGTSTTSKKPGLQRYSFEDKTWKTILATGSVTSNRTRHAAVFLKDSSSILVYGGNQKDGSYPTSDTFVLQTVQPYMITARSGEKAFPTVSPILLPWNNQEAALVGGLTSTSSVYLYDPTKGWRNTTMTIPNELADDVECAIVRRSDGTKILQIFEMGASPNTVTSTVLSKSTNSGKQKRDNGYPKYDDTNASSTKREDYSLAQDGQLVVISSGNGMESLAIFNQTANSWVNATQLFYGNKSEQEILATTTASTTPEASASTTPTTSESSSSNSTYDSGTSAKTIVGATLGSLLGVIVILVFILFLIKLKKNKRKRQHGDGVDKDRLSFQDQGVEPLTRSAYPMAKTQAPLAASSVDSLAIFSGGKGDEKSPRPTGGLPPHIQRPSPLTTIVSSGNITATSGYSRNDKAIEAGVFAPSGHPVGDRRTDEGWGRYFQDNSATSLVAPQQQHQSHGEPGSRGTLWPVGGNGAPPLNLNFLDQPQPLGRVLSGSPTTEHASTSIKDGRRLAFPDGQSAQISSADSISLNSQDDHDLDRRHEPQAHVQSWIDRPPSSNYSTSYYNNNHGNYELPSTTAPPAQDYRKHDSARTNTRGSSILISDGSPMPRNNINSDMSWLNLRGER